ncbi:MAG: hypothetical protein ACREBG_13825 [Pyrinomonadaceae bacterium]
MPLAVWAIPKLCDVVSNVVNYSLQFVLWIQGESALKRIWYYLNHKFTVGNIEVSATSLVLGLIVFVSAVVLARFVSSLLQRRIAARANLDPGIRYTIARLANYFLITILLTRFSFTGMDARTEPSSPDQKRYQLPHCQTISRAGN